MGANPTRRAGAAATAVLTAALVVSGTACTTGLGPVTALGSTPVIASPSAGTVADLAHGHPTGSGEAGQGGPPADPTRAWELLAALPVRVEDTGAHYDRDQWGGWRTREGCSTRERVLIRDGHDVTTGEDCAVTGGRWRSVYDGQSVPTADGIEIDHRVAPAEATRSGARGWTREQRVRFFNDPANLLAVSAHINGSKSDDDPARWRPPHRDAWCGYAAAYVATKHTYRLAVDADEHAGLVALLNTCPAGGEQR